MTRSVLDITEYYGETSGGVRTYLTEKATYAAARSSIRQAIAVPAAADSMEDRAGVRWYSIGSPPIPGQHPYRLVINGRRVNEIIRAERPDVIEVGSAYSVPWLVRRTARSLRIPVVWFFHGHIPRIIAPRLDAEPWRRRWLAAVAARYVAAIGRGMARTLVASDFARHDLERFGVERVTRVPLGVDADTFTPARRERRAEIRRRWGLAEQPLAIYTGRLTTEKDLTTAVDGWRLLRHDDAVLLLIGAGPLASRLEARARNARVRIVPFVHERETLADLYAAADFYLAPGPAETFGLSAHEALASGTPVLSVDAGAVAEQVARSGAGAVYPLGDPAGLAEAADAMLDTDRTALGTKGRDFIVRHHRWPAVFDRLFEVYDEVVAAA